MDIVETLPSAEDLELLLWLNSVPRVGPAAARLLLNHYKSPQAIFHASDFDTVPGLRPHMVEELRRATKDLTSFKTEARRILETVQRLRILLLTPLSPLYPAQLRHPTSYGPTVLYVLGDPSRLSTNGGAIVGTRSPTPEAIQKTREAAKTIVQAKQAVFSGLAKGIDAEGHRAALDNGGTTIAVLGCGVDRIYPAENADLYRRIMHSGAIISEYLPGTAPSPENLRRRNRLIVGLSQFVLVAECPDNSGAMIAARASFQQQRPVLVLQLERPGFEKQRSGTNLLARSELAMQWDGSKIASLSQYITNYQRPPSAEAKLDEALGKPSPSARKSTENSVRPQEGKGARSGVAKKTALASSNDVTRQLPERQSTLDKPLEQKAIAVEAINLDGHSIQEASTQNVANTTPALASPPKAKPPLKPGQRVRHATFGVGTVKRVDPDAIELKFDTDKKRSRRFLLEFLPLLEVLPE